MQLTNSPKVQSFSTPTRLAPPPSHRAVIVAIIHASFSKRTPITVYMSNKQVNSTLIAYWYISVYILYAVDLDDLFVGHVKHY